MREWKGREGGERERGAMGQPPPLPHCVLWWNLCCCCCHVYHHRRNLSLSFFHHNCCIPSYCALAASDEKGLKALSNIHPDIKRERKRERERRGEEKEKVKRKRKEQKWEEKRDCVHIRKKG